MIKGEEKQCDFEQWRADIREFLVAKEDFHVALRMLMNLHNILIKQKKCPKFQIWYTLYNSGYCCKKLEMYNEAFDLLSQSLEYTDGNDDINYASSLWMMANTYEMINDKIAAKHIYNKLIEYYKENNCEIDRMIMMLNVAYIDNKIKRMCLITNYLVNEIINNIDKTNANKEKMQQQILDMVNEVKENLKLTNDDFYYNKIILRLSKIKPINIRKNLLALNS